MIRRIRNWFYLQFWKDFLRTATIGKIKREPNMELAVRLAKMKIAKYGGSKCTGS